MEFTITLALPRDELSIPISRRVLKQSLHSFGVSDECVHDIVLALSEACTNVLRHAQHGREYEIRGSIRDDLCVIDVIDTGRGFDSTTLGFDESSPEAERGRGIQLMRALVDQVSFRGRVDRGTVVHLEKRLSWADDAALPRLSRVEADSVGGIPG